MEYTISVSKTGIPCIGVGGGGKTNSYVGRAVFQCNGGALKLKEAFFVKSRGHLSCSKDQAIVPVNVRDIIVEYEGYLPIQEENPDARYSLYRVVDIDTERGIAVTEDVNMDVWNEVFTPNIITGLSTYHNRDGMWFAAAKDEE